MTAKTTRKTLTAAIATALAAGGMAATAPMASAAVPSTDIGGTHETPHFRVTAKSMSTSDNLTHADVEVCSKMAGGKVTRVSWEPWSLLDVQGKEFGAGKYEGGSEDSTYPYGDGAPPNGKVDPERYLRPGECATGRVSFAKDPAVQSKQVVYRNSFDEVLVWNLDS